MKAIVHIISDARGIYIPREFLTDGYNEIAVDHCAKWGLTEANREYWEDAANPDSEYYWEAWDWILSNAEFKDGEDVYQLYQDGDLWALCYEKMDDEEKTNFGFKEY